MDVVLFRVDMSVALWLSVLWVDASVALWVSAVFGGLGGLLPAQCGLILCVQAGDAVDDSRAKELSEGYENMDVWKGRSGLPLLGCVWLSVPLGLCCAALSI